MTEQAMQIDSSVNPLGFERAVPVFAAGVSALSNYSVFPGTASSKHDGTLNRSFYDISDPARVFVRCEY